MIVKGLGLPNRQWELYTQPEEAALIDLAPNGMLVLCYPGSPLLKDKVAQDLRLWRELGGPCFLLRPYMDNLVQWDPLDWAAECDLLCRMYREGGCIPELIPANEMNVEGWGEDWERIEWWLGNVATFFIQKRDGIKLHLPALSPRGNYRVGWQFFQSRDLHWLYDFVDIHAYTEADIQSAQAAKDLFQKEIVCTEVNQMPPSFYIPKLASMGCRSSYWFILSGTQDQRPYHLMGGPFYDDFKYYKGSLMTREELWDQLTAPYESFPALTKPIIAMGGTAVGDERTEGGYTLQFGLLPSAGGTPTKVVFFARTGDWGNVQPAYSPKDLPDTASH